MLHLITCHGRIMPRLAELLLSFPFADGMFVCLFISLSIKFVECRVKAFASKFIRPYIMKTL